jgi:hypothetical protein
MKMITMTIGEIGLRVIGMIGMKAHAKIVQGQRIVMDGMLHFVVPFANTRAGMIAKTATQWICKPT